MVWWVDKEPGNLEVVSFIVPFLLPHGNPRGLLKAWIPTPTERGRQGEEAQSRGVQSQRECQAPSVLVGGYHPNNTGQAQGLNTSSAWVSSGGSCWDKTLVMGIRRKGSHVYWVSNQRPRLTLQGTERRDLGNSDTKSSFPAFSRHIKEPGKKLLYLFHRWEVWDSREVQDPGQGWDLAQVCKN